MPKPNIVLIVLHDLGDWLGCYGHRAVSSPNLDRLATEGVVFENFYCTAPQCSPSRASMMTGLMPHATGVFGLIHRGFDMKHDVTTLAQYLKQSGYTTHLIGLQHECRDPVGEGYDEIQTAQSDAEFVATEAERFLQRDFAPDAAPFFLSLGTKDIHRPHGQEYDPSTLAKIKLPPYLPDVDVAYRDMAVFFQRIEQADRQLGRIFTALEKSRVRENTLLIVTTDHGAAIPRAKQSLYDSGLKIAMFMHWPGHIEGGTRCFDLRSNVDLVPTILEICGSDVPNHLHGSSFAASLYGNASATPVAQGDEAIYAELTWHCHYRPMRAIRTKAFKYIINFVPGIPMLLEDGAITRYGPAILEAHYGQPLPDDELYDLGDDPSELQNRADDPAYRAIKEDLRRRLLAHLQDTEDPILRGPISNPEPERTKQEYWYQQNGRFRLHEDGEWIHSAP